jgi:hypothetical protein
VTLLPLPYCCRDHLFSAKDVQSCLPADADGRLVAEVNEVFEITVGRCK